MIEAKKKIGKAERKIWTYFLPVKKIVTRLKHEGGRFFLEDSRSNDENLIYAFGAV